MLRAVLFDMDGLMINTEPLQSQAYEQIIRDHGKEPVFNAEGVIQKVGVRERDNWELIKDNHDLDEETENLIEKRAGVYMDILKRHPQA